MVENLVRSGWPNTLLPNLAAHELFSFQNELNVPNRIDLDRRVIAIKKDIQFVSKPLLEYLFSNTIYYISISFSNIVHKLRSRYQ